MASTEHWCIKTGCTHGTLNGSLHLGSMLLAEWGKGYAQGRKEADQDRAAGAPAPDLRGYPVTLYREEDGSWSVMAPDLPGHVGAAMTIADAIWEAADAMAAWIEAAEENGMPVPPPSDPHA